MPLSAAMYNGAIDPLVEPYSAVICARSGTPPAALAAFGALATDPLVAACTLALAAPELAFCTTLVPPHAASANAIAPTVSRRIATPCPSSACIISCSFHSAPWHNHAQGA